MFLKYNISKYKQKKRLINVMSIDIDDTNQNYLLLKVNTNNPHKLNVGDNIILECLINETDNYVYLMEQLNKGLDKIVFLSKDIIVDDKKYETGYYELKGNKISLINEIGRIKPFKGNNRFEYNFKVGENDFNNKTFSFSFNKYPTFYVDDVFIDGNSLYFHIKDDLDYEFNEGDNLIIRKKYSYYKEVATFSNNEDVVYLDNDPSTSDYLGYNNIVFNEKLYEWKSGITEINSTFMSKNLFKYTSDMSVENELKIGESIEIEDKRFINLLLYSNIKIYENSNFLNLLIPLSNENNDNLNDEDISKKYFNEKKDELIPDITDYEKLCFLPVYNVSASTYTLLNEVKFNLFFRDRLNDVNSSDIEKWSTNDAMGWFQYKMSTTSSFSKNPKITNGDLLGDLGFTDEDVYYRKKILSKSFLRLLFYDSNDPLKQQLLYYSTVFIDANDLYNKYIKNINNTNNDTKQIVNSSDFGDDNLTVTFSIYDKYNRNKSSEGYYLYLFPEMIGKTIYMKVEFNHAKYGKTIPLIAMTNGQEKMIKTVFGSSANNDKFITSFVSSQKNEINKFYKNLYIPLTLEYDNKTKNYVYYFNSVTNENYDNTLNKLTINLYEPKINGVD